MKVLVAGGAGFIGSFVVEDLINRGHEVCVLVRSTTDLWRIREIEKIYGVNINTVEYSSYVDLQEKVEEFFPKVVINMAVYYQKWHKYSDIQPMVDSMINFSTHLLDASVLVGVEKFVTIGTSFEYAMDEEFISEKSEILPYDLYGALKYAFQQIAYFYAMSYGIKVRILKPFFVYGYRDNPDKLLTAIINASRDKVFELTPGYQQIDYVFVKDVARAIILAAEDDMPSLFEVFNVGSGKAYFLREVVETLLRLLPESPQIKWGAKPYAEREIMMLRADITKIRNKLGWLPKYSLKAGLNEMVRYYMGG